MAACCLWYESQACMISVHYVTTTWVLIVFTHYSVTQISRRPLERQQLIPPAAQNYCLHTESQRDDKHLPVCELPYEGVGNQLYGGLGGKQQSHFDVLIEQLAGGLGAVGGVLRRLCGGGGCGDQVSRPGCGVGAWRPHSIVVQGHNAVEGSWGTLLQWSIVLQHHLCWLI